MPESLDDLIRKKEQEVFAKFGATSLDGAIENAKQRISAGTPSEWGSAGRAAARSAAPTAGGIAGGIAGAKGGAAIGAAIGSVIPGAGTAAGGAVGGFIGGIGGAVAGAFGASTAQEALIDATVDDKASFLGGAFDPDTIRRDVEVNPLSTMGGEVLPAVATFNPVRGIQGAARAVGTTKQLASSQGRQMFRTLPKVEQRALLDNVKNVAVGTGVEVGVEGAQQAYIGEFDPMRLVQAGIAGTVLNEPNRFGRAVGLRGTADQFDRMPELVAAERAGVNAEATAALGGPGVSLTVFVPNRGARRMNVSAAASSVSRTSGSVKVLKADSAETASPARSMCRATLLGSRRAVSRSKWGLQHANSMASYPSSAVASIACSRSRANRL